MEMEVTGNGGVKVEEKKYLDEESRKIVKFFKSFNVVLIIFALIGTFWLAYNHAESVQQAKMFYEGSSAFADYSSYSSYEGGSQIDAFTFLVIATIGTGYSVLQFYFIKLMVKHFENTAELKSIQKEALERSR